MVVQDVLDALLGQALQEVLESVGFKPDQIEGAVIQKGRGCRTCGDTGYKGRVALYEVMPFSESLKNRVLEGANTAELKMEMIRSGTDSLRMAGIIKILEGTTTIDEVLRVTAADAVMN